MFDASVVRGLAYYTGVVFEAFDTAGALRAICGGGRYDRLLESLGGPSLPAVGFGDAVIHELLLEHGLVPELPRGLDEVVYGFGDTERTAAIGVAQRLRESGASVDLVLGQPKPKRVFADADRAGAARVWLIGPDEAGRGVSRVKHLASGEQVDVAFGQESHHRDQAPTDA